MVESGVPDFSMMNSRNCLTAVAIFSKARGPTVAAIAESMVAEVLDKPPGGGAKPWLFAKACGQKSVRETTLRRGRGGVMAKRGET